MIKQRVIERRKHGYRGVRPLRTYVTMICTTELRNPDKYEAGFQVVMAYSLGHAKKILAEHYERLKVQVVFVKRALARMLEVPEIAGTFYSEWVSMAEDA